jgi:Mrp family chromosome partitioning ATPase
VHDALVFGKVADRIMLMVRCNSTSINDVEASMKMMQVVGLEPTSLVLNQVRTSGATQQQYSDYLVSS